MKGYTTMKQKKTYRRPLYQRVLCWILVILMLLGSAYTAIWAIISLLG